MPVPTAPVLVIGATSQQGGATARALLADGVPVRALVRDPSSDRSRDVERAAGVPHIVYSSVTGAGQHTVVPGWTDRRWPIEATLTAKTEIQDLVRSAGFRTWAILKPGTFMENFLTSSASMFPRGLEGGLVSVLDPETRLSLIAVDDIGVAAAAAFADPARFGGVELELAGDHLSMTEIAATLSEVLGMRLRAPEMTADEAIAAGMPAPLVAHEWLNVAGQPGRPEHAEDLGIPVTSFATWARAHLGRGA